MAKPDKLRIPHYTDDERFGLIGKYDVDKQFMAFISGAMPKNWGIHTYTPEYIQDHWDRHKRWYAILHQFDADGTHLDTQAWSGGTSEQDEYVACGRATRKLHEMIGEMGDVQFGDIFVKPFVVELDGYLFGLIYKLNNFDDPGNPGATYECAMLEPNDIMFHPPWDSGEWSS